MLNARYATRNFALNMVQWSDVINNFFIVSLFFFNIMRTIF
jgi:hypothetical protein